MFSIWISTFKFFQPFIWSAFIVKHMHANSKNRNNSDWLSPKMHLLIVFKMKKSHADAGIVTLRNVQTQTDNEMNNSRSKDTSWLIFFSLCTSMIQKKLSYQIFINLHQNFLKCTYLNKDVLSEKRQAHLSNFIQTPQMSSCREQRDKTQSSRRWPLQDVFAIHL